MKWNHVFFSFYCSAASRSASRRAFIGESKMLNRTNLLLTLQKRKTCLAQNASWEHASISWPMGAGASTWITAFAPCFLWNSSPLQGISEDLASPCRGLRKLFRKCDVNDFTSLYEVSPSCFCMGIGSMYRVKKRIVAPYGAMCISCRAKTSGRSRHAPSVNSGLGSGSPNSTPKITNHRPGLFSNMAMGGESLEGSRLVGGRSHRNRPEYEIRQGGSGRQSGGNTGLYSCQEAPQRPKWWRFWKRNLPGSSATKQDRDSWRSTSFSSLPGRDRVAPGKAPLNPLHSLEKTNWISLLGGGPPLQDRSYEGEERDAARPSSSSFFFSRKKKNTGASPLEQDLNTTRSTSRFLQAAKALHGKKKGERVAFTALLSDEQKLAIVNKEIESKWWARFWYRPFRHVTDHRIRTTKRILHVFLFVFSVTFFLASVYLYREEMKILESLAPQDKADYIYLITNMRFSDVWHMAMEVLNKEDPLEALPPAARYHLAMEEARKRGWTSTVDWEVEQRVLHPNSALEEGDYLHVFYWVMMYIGSIASGGGSVFTTRFLGDSSHATVAAQQEAIQTEPKLIGPFAPPSHFSSS